MGLYTRAIDALVDRIQAHVMSGLLRGVNFRRELAAEVEGKADLPWLRMTGAIPVESYTPQMVVRANLEVGLVLATDPKDGLGGLLRMTELLFDAIEMDVQGHRDPSLGLLDAAVTFRATNLFATPVALHQNLIVVMKLPRALRGQRRL